MPQRIYAGTVGLNINVDMKTTISAASAYSFEVKKPGGTTETWIPTIETSTKFRYITESGDIDEIGTYVIQPHLTLGAWTGHGLPVKFSVVPAIL
jgi:hypothetical protein